MRLVILSRVTLAAALVLSAAGVTAAEPNMKPGMWETTIETEMTGMPMGMGVPPMTTRQCITKEDLVPDTNRGGQECELIDTRIDGDTVTWHIRCTSQGMTTEGNGTITYRGESYAGTIHMNMSGGPMGTMNMNQKISGKRVGECQ